MERHWGHWDHLCISIGLQMQRRCRHKCISPLERVMCINIHMMQFQHIIDLHGSCSLSHQVTSLIVRHFEFWWEWKVCFTCSSSKLRQIQSLRLDDAQCFSVVVFQRSENLHKHFNCSCTFKHILTRVSLISKIIRLSTIIFHIAKPDVCIVWKIVKTPRLESFWTVIKQIIRQCEP